MDDQTLRDAVSRYKWYHIIDLGQGVVTPGNPTYVPAQEMCLKHLGALDLKGKRVLDIGCRDGLFCFAAEKMGAEEVIGIDNDLSKPAVEFLIPHFKSKVKMHQMNVYDLDPKRFGLFDVVVFPGVLYHLRYPFWALRAIRSVLKKDGHLLIETAIWRGEPNNAMLFCPVGPDSPYEPTSCTFFNEKGLSDTLLSLGLSTITTEYLGRSGLRGMVGRWVRGLWAWVKRPPILFGASPAPIRTVTRAVSHSVYRGHEESSFLTHYWEDTHDFHSREGG
jgi:2-polyprenyl-3-methyl-5-hydroxy-6-metoxy-1,4-benzoquinol methylase